ncbi:SIN3 like paired amphipathic helix domain-containing protein [Cryptosporidium ubiquitum]|uniref:SIN3 like paired amphipathic helix domain-containing protein n=1 Tax=Cryptosporidium ubiquitum TaxID=857276 RepID=A0A1J4MQW3_9CRYT|nr:SIN3 like paired amphipathic helix domain-containing protein [Cryptosporidium ubiquitum]OII75396.1 SIN3 like paired amphipathic helix domain-containing protein [Cryptosporidium ubiquitum]
MDLARDYLSRLRSKCGEDTELYQEFLRIMRDFKHGSINARMVIDQVAELFKKDTSLIAEFNNFLPEELRLQIPQNDCEYAAAFVKKVKDVAPEIYNDFLLLLGKYKDGEKSVNEVCELSSSLFASYPDLLKEFVLFIPELSGKAESLMQSNKQSAGNNLSDLQNDFLDKSEFLSYLASTVHSITTKSEPPKVVTRRASSTLPYEMTVVPELDRILENQKKRLSSIEEGGEINDKLKSENLKQGAGNVRGYSSQKGAHQGYYYNPEDLSIWEADYRIFEEVYIAFGDNCQDYYQDFLKLIHLYTRGVFTVVETLLALEFFFPMDSGDLPYEVKRMIVQRESARRKYSYFCCNFAQLDYSNSARNGSSYLHLPKDYPIASCTGRIQSDRENLNDKWVSIPQGSEDFSFKHMRKNVYEENLFKCEDERFELDMVIENNRSTINVLEPIAEEISKLSPEDKKNFRLVKPPFSIIHLKAISRIYGDNGPEILELLRRTPYSCIPVILNRLRQKDEEWTHARHLMNQGVWRDIQTKNYFKSFDHRSFYFRQADKKNTNVKGFLCDINKAYIQNRKTETEPNHISQMGSGITNPKIDSVMKNIYQDGFKEGIHQLNETEDRKLMNNSLRFKNESNSWSVDSEFTSQMPDLDVHKEVIELISFTIYRQANGPAVGSKARNFLQRFVRSLFLQTGYGSLDNGVVTLKELQSEGTPFKAGVGKNIQGSTSNGNFSSSSVSGTGEKSLLSVEAYVNAVTEGNGSTGNIPFNSASMSRGRRMTRNHLRKSNISGHISEDVKSKSQMGDDVIDSEDQNASKISDLMNRVGESTSIEDANAGGNSSNSNNSENASSNEENDLNTIFKSFSSTYDCRGGLKYIWSDNCKVNWHSNNLSPDWFYSKKVQYNSEGRRISIEPLDVGELNKLSSSNDPGDMVRYIMGNDHVCCFMRYYQIIYERLKKAKSTIEQREQNPLPFQRWSPNGPDVPRPTYKQVIWCCFGLLSGELELSLFEDICRDAMGNDSYWLGTIDKVLQGISKVVIHIVNDLATCRLMAMNLAYRDTVFDHYKKLEEFIAACRSLLPTIQTSFYIITWSPGNSVLKIRMRQLEDYPMTFAPFIQSDSNNIENLVQNMKINNHKGELFSSVSTKEDMEDKQMVDLSKTNGLSQESKPEVEEEAEEDDDSKANDENNNEDPNIKSVNSGLKSLSEMKLIPPERTSKYLDVETDQVEVGQAVDLTNHVELLQQVLVHQLTNVNDEAMDSSENIKLDQFSDKENVKISKLLQNNPVSFFVCMEQTFVKPLLYYSPKMKFIAKLAASAQWLGFLPDNSHRDIARSPSILRESNSNNSIRHVNEPRKANRRGLLSAENHNQTDDDKGHWSEESAESNSRTMISNNAGRKGTGKKRTRGMPSDMVTEIDDLDIRVTRRRAGNTSRGGFRR